MSEFSDLRAELAELERENLSLRDTVAELRSRNKDLGAILDHAATPIYLKDANGRYLYVNKHFEGLRHATVADLLGQDDHDLFTEPVAEMFRDQDRAVQDAGARLDFEETVQLPHGELHFITSKFPVFDENDEICAVGGFCTNITELKKMEQSLAISEERFRLVFEASRDAISIATLDGTFLEVNDGFLQITGTGRDEIIGRSAAELGMWEDLAQHHDFVERLRTQGSISDLESPCRSRDGSAKTILLSASLIQLRGEPHVLTVGRDITDLKRAEREREGLQQQLHRVQKLESLGVLAGGIAHDFNNILSAILGSIELALIKRDEVQQSQMLGQAKEACLRARGLTQQLLTFAKGGDPVKRTASMEEIVRGTADFVLRGSRTRCEYEVAKAPLHADVDSGQISQVIQNLILNAQDAMAGGGVVRVGIRLHRLGKMSVVPLPEGDYVRIDVSDDGPGIHAEDLQRIFDPYFTTKSNGTGLGLAICHSSISKHGGHLAVESVPDQGSTFSIYLPAELSASACAENAAPAPQQRSSAKILVMDDDAMVREVAHCILFSAGHEVILSKDGREAVALFEEGHVSGHPFDLVILDLTVPGGMGGLQTIAAITEIDAAAKVVVSSGYSVDPVLAHFRQHGFCGAIAKPFELRELLALVADTVAKTG